MVPRSLGFSHSPRGHECRRSTCRTDSRCRAEPATLERRQRPPQAPAGSPGATSHRSLRSSYKAKELCARRGFWPAMRASTDRRRGTNASPARCKAQCARSSAKRKSSRIRCCYYPERPLDRNCSGNPAWDRLRIIAIERNISLSHLWGNIENIMRLDPPWPGHRRCAACRQFASSSWRARRFDRFACRASSHHRGDDGVQFEIQLRRVR